MQERWYRRGRETQPTPGLVSQAVGSADPEGDIKNPSWLLRETIWQMFRYLTVAIFKYLSI